MPGGIMTFGKLKPKGPGKLKLKGAVRKRNLSMPLLPTKLNGHQK
jgi:hypothetical protein